MADQDQDFWALPTAQQLKGFSALPAQSETWDQKDTTVTMDPAQKARVQADLARTDAEYQSRSKAYGEEAPRVRAADEKAANAADEALSHAMSDEAAWAAREPPLESAKMHWEPHPIVDSHDFQNFGTALLAMSLIAGIASKGNWQGATDAMTGAMQGYMQGDKQRAEQEWAIYEQHYKEALEHDKAVQAQFNAILRSKTLSVNQRLREVQQLAVANGRHEQALAAEQRDLDRLMQNHAAMDMALGRVETHHDTTGTQMKAGVTGRSAIGQSGMEHLDSYGGWLMKNLIINGNTNIPHLLTSRYGGPMSAAIVNDIGKFFHEHNIDPRQINQATLNNQVQLSVQRTASNRLAGVERLALSISATEKELARMVSQVNGNSSMTWSSFRNAWTQRFGTGPAATKLAQLQGQMATIGREYIEMATMPGSNAQLHATQSQWADEHFSGNMNMAQYMGTFRAVNFAIKFTDKALRQTIEESKKHEMDTGLSIPYVPDAPGLPKDIEQAAGITSDEGYNPFAEGAAAATRSPAAGATVAAPPAPAATSSSSSSSSSSSGNLQDRLRKYRGG